MKNTTNNLPHQAAIDQFIRSIGPLLLHSKNPVLRKRTEEKLRSYLPAEEVDAMLEQRPSQS